MQNTIKNLEAQVQNAVEPRQRVDALNMLAWTLLKDDYQRAVTLSQEAYQLAHEGEFADVPYQEGIAHSLCTLARSHLYEGRYDLSLSKSYEALTLLEELNLVSLIPHILNTIACNYVVLGNGAEGLANFLKQLQISQEIGDEESYATALMGIGWLYAEQDDYENALAYSEQSLAVLRKLNHPYWLALVLSNISDYHPQLGNYELALTYALESLAIGRQHEMRRVEAMACYTLSEIYLNLDETDKALAYIEESMALAEQLNNPDMMIGAFKLRGCVYYQLQQFDEAISQLLQGVTLAQETNHKRLLYECYHLLADIYKQRGDFEQALNYYEQFHALKETVFSQESDEKIRNLEVMHRTEAVQKEAKLYASLYEEEQSRRLLAETLEQMGRVLSSTLDLQAVLDNILEQLAQLVHYDRAAILLKQDNYLEFVAVRGFPADSEFLRHKVLLHSKSNDVFWQIYQLKQALALENLADYKGWQQVNDLPFPGAWLGVPLIYEDEVKGLLSLVREAVMPYEARAVKVASMFAASATVALENARLYNYTKEFNAQMDYEVRHRTHELRKAYEVLERLDKTKSDFIMVMAHELRTPLTIIKSYTQLLGMNPSIQADETLSRPLAGILSGVERLHDMVNMMLTMTRIESRELQLYFEQLNVYEIVDGVVSGLAQDIEDRQLTVVLDDGLPDLPLIEGDEGLLKTVFYSVIINAIKYTPDRGRIDIHGRFWQEPPQEELPANGVEIVVSDTGIGIDAQALELIFTKFYQTGDVALHSSGKSKFKGGGPGLGLAIAQGIVQAHRGHIWARSEGSDEKTCPGSEVHIVLPVSQASRK